MSGCLLFFKIRCYSHWTWTTIILTLNLCHKKIIIQLYMLIMNIVNHLWKIFQQKYITIANHPLKRGSKIVILVQLLPPPGIDEINKYIWHTYDIQWQNIPFLRSNLLWWKRNDKNLKRGHINVICMHKIQALYLFYPTPRLFWVWYVEGELLASLEAINNIMTAVLEVWVSNAFYGLKWDSQTSTTTILILSLPPCYLGLDWLKATTEHFVAYEDFFSFFF